MTKLKLLFEVVIILFGISAFCASCVLPCARSTHPPPPSSVNVGAAVGGMMDRRERQLYVEKLRQPHLGYRVAEGGAWLWSFSIEPMRDIIDAPSGPAVEICELLGIPFARLRYALPDEMLSWDMPIALGRLYGMSRSGWESTAKELKEKLPSFFGTLRRPRKVGESLLDPAVAEEMERARLAMITMEEFVGTAVVLAFLQVAALMPVAELAERGSAARQHFEGVRTAAGRDFDTTRTECVPLVGSRDFACLRQLTRAPLFCSFVTLLSPGILNSAKKWLPRARLWKLILSQNTAGYWCVLRVHRQAITLPFLANAFACRDVSSTTALVLEARAAHEVDALPKSFLKRLFDVMRSMFETMADAEAAGNEDEAVDGRREQDDLDDLFEFHEEGEEEADDETPRVHRRAKRRPATDCPVTCSAEAIVMAIPHALTKLATDVPTAVKLRRVWTTMCCIAVLERLVVCWLWGDGELYPPEERCVSLRAHASGVCRALISPSHVQHDCGRWGRVDRGAGGGVAKTGSRPGRRQVDEGSA